MPRPHQTFALDPTLDSSTLSAVELQKPRAANPTFTHTLVSSQIPGLRLVLGPVSVAVLTTLTSEK